jgi:hypothetical protein
VIEDTSGTAPDFFSIVYVDHEVAFVTAGDSMFFVELPTS